MELNLKSKKEYKDSNTLEIVGWFLLAIFLIVYWCFIYKYTFLLTDSDLASNFVYGKLLINEGVLISKNWYFSTYVDIFNIDKFYLIGMLISDNYQIAQFIGTVLANLFLLGSFIFACKSLNIKHISWLSFLVMGAMSYDACRFVNYFPIYAVYNSYIYLSIAFFFRFINHDGKKKIIDAIFLFLMIVFASMSGIRNIVTLVLPILGALIIFWFIKKVIKKEILNFNIKEFGLANLIVLVGTIVGYAINKLLVLYVNYEGMPFGLTSAPLLDFFSTFKDTFMGWINLSGINGLNFQSLLSLIILIVIIYFSFKYLFKKESDIKRRYIVLTFILSACAVSASFFVTDDQVISDCYRYLLQSYSLLYLILGFALSDINKAIYRNILLGIIVLAVVLNTKVNFVNHLTNFEPVDKELNEISDILEENNVTDGYASFWNANVITELTDGKIDVWCFESEKTLAANEDGSIKIYEWLQNKAHNIDPVSSSIFFITENHLLKHYDSSIQEYCEYTGDSKSLFIFDDLDTFKKFTLSYN